VIDPALQRRLYDQSPYNVIRMEYNREESGDAPGQDRYARAAGFLDTWQRSGVLRTDQHPTLYLHEQTFQVDGRTLTRRGFFARVRLEPFGSGRIYPHEQTLAGPKADRLALYRATGFNLSPVFGLYPDETGAVLAAVEKGLTDRTPLEATDHLGVINRMWPVTDQRAHTVVQGLMADRSIFIADGHHRYETALKYRDELAEKGELSGPDDPANYVLMMLVGMSDPGLQILPTHRLVSGFPGLTRHDLAEILAAEFDIAGEEEGEKGAHHAWQEVELWGDQDMLAFGTVADGRWLTARLRSDETMDRIVPDRGADWRGLGVSILHELVLKHLLGKKGEASCRYVHLLSEVIDDVAAKGCDLACLVPPARMEDVQAIASNHEKMPPKSTYFYPKIMTGLVLNPIR
jgi:uncharacterized protein (DUF1015 family)